MFVFCLLNYTLLWRMRPRMMKEAEENFGREKKSLPEVAQGFVQGSGVTEATKMCCILTSDGTSAATIVNFAGCGVHQNVVNGYKLLGYVSINTGITVWMTEVH